MLSLRKITASFIAFCAVACVTEPVWAENSDAAVSRGGRLYNDWMVELDDTPPEKPNKRMTLTEKTDKAVADSWRCVTCHGWDYKGANGVKGIIGRAGDSLENIVATLKDRNHEYQAYLDPEDMKDLARFISVGMTDVDATIDRETGLAKAKGMNQRPFFDTVCAMCHGAEGQSLPGISLGQFAIEQPYLTLHSIYNGHPGAVMPSLRAFDDKNLVELLAYMQMLPVNASLVSIVRGGRLYDNWFMESNGKVPMGVHPSYPRNMEIEIKPRQTWLCKECHGWDYKGKDGQFAKGKHFTGIKGIQGMKGAKVTDIIDVLKDRNHEYGAVMTSQDLLDLANFVREGQVEMDDYIDPSTRMAKGEAERHEGYYPTLCGNCHGEKGRAIRTMGALGGIANNDPWKSLHKVLNGHPAEEMPAWRSLDMETIQDLMGYIQTLPKKKRS